MRLDVNAKDMVVFANKLEKMSKSALPVAVRSALNSTAFDVKQNTMPKKAVREFVQRDKNFFKANSRVDMARGFDVNNMKSTVGFISRNGKNQAVEDLEKQEYGGAIKGRSFIPLDQARAGNVNRGKVRAGSRISKMRIVRQRAMKSKSKGGRFAVAMKTAGVGGFVLGENGILWRVNSLDRDKNGRYKITGVFSFKKGRSVRVDRTNFMREASTQSSRKMEDFFVKEAKRQITKLRNR